LNASVCEDCEHKTISHVCLGQKHLPIPFVRVCMKDYFYSLKRLRILGPQVP